MVVREAKDEPKSEPKAEAPEPDVVIGADGLAQIVDGFPFEAFATLREVAAANRAESSRSRRSAARSRTLGDTDYYPPATVSARPRTCRSLCSIVSMLL